MISQGRWALRITTTVTLAACFFVLAGGALLALNLREVLTLWGDDIQVTAYLSQDLPEQKIDEMEKDLQQDQRIGRLQRVSREQALKEFKTEMASYAPDLAGDDDLFSLIPTSFQISLARAISIDRQAEEIGKLAHDLKTRAGVEEVTWGQEWVKKYSAVVHASESLFSGLGAILLAAALLVVSNAIRASVDRYRHRIEVLELIGATAAQIRRPFLIEGSVLGGVSAATGLVIAALVFLGVRDLMRDQLNFLQLSSRLTFFSVFEVTLFVLGGTILGAAAAWICARRINTGWAARGKGA